MSSLIHTDVTAVKLYDEYILTGIGSSASIYKKDSLEFLASLTCLRGQKIYGFVPLKETNDILVFGGKQYTVLSLEYSEGSYVGNIELRKCFEAIVCDDWLHSATWLSGNLVALLTAHNTVQIWDIKTQTLTKQYLSPENSILYSGLLLSLKDGFLVFAGTVFSEIIIHDPEEKQALHRLKGHRGVIFSISCYPEKGVIVSTSDDRSVRIWGISPTNSMCYTHDTAAFWNNIDFVCKHEVYGHMARVMRSCIADDFIISVGEDSALCFWDYNGKLLRKNVTHQNSAIWSVDADDHDVVTGGGDGAVILHPLAIASEYGHQKSLKLETALTPIPKKLAFTARRNLIVLDESQDAIHYVSVSENKSETHNLNHGSTNKFLSISSCKQLIAVANMSGKLEVFVESCKDAEHINNIISTNLNIGTIFSMQWIGSRHLIFCTGNGAIKVLSANKSEVDIFTEFILPVCKERWLTAAAIHANNKTFIVGDRCGNIHVFDKGSKNPIKSFPKVHGRYGPTSITINGDRFISTGRDGTIKYFALDENKKDLAKLMSKKDLEFQWAEKFIDRDQNIICGFKERVFVIYNVKDNMKLVEVPCGGGHRTWDVVRYIEKVGDKYEEIIRLVYVKTNDIFTHTFQLSKIVSKNVINSTHSKEINCLKSFTRETDESITYFITGGEDTTLRISSLSSKHAFCDDIVFKHLSNVRSLKTFKQGDKIIVLSGGGRAQICVKLIDVENDKHKLSSQELVSYMIKGGDKQRKNNKTWKDCTIDFDPETRIMDLDLLERADGKFLIFAGCSDACLRVFLFSSDANAVLFEPIAELWHHKTCILKTTCTRLLGHQILITCTTRGEVSLWDVTNVYMWDNLAPFFTIRTNKCGINAVDANNLPNDKLLIVTAGDDNAVHLNVLEAADMKLHNTHVKHSWVTDRFHCSQVTGAKLVDNLLVTTSIDQRVTLAKWSVEEEDGIKCEFLSQVYSDIADIQGVEILANTSEAISLCVFGKGVQVLQLSKR